MSDKLAASVEAAIFASKGISLRKLCRIFKIKEGEMLNVIEKIKEEYSKELHGIELREIDGKYRFYTKKEFGNIATKAAGKSFSKLTSSQLEIVVILIMHGDLSRKEIDQIRGKDSSNILRSLVEMRVLRRKRKGRSVLYTFTRSFKESSIYEELSYSIRSDSNDEQ